MFFVPTQYYYPCNNLGALNALYSGQSQRVRFTKEEDELLKQLVNNQSQPNWNEISRYMKSRTARQCRERYNNYLRPNLVNGPWTQEEDELLIELYEKYGPKWSFISQSFNSRSPVNLKNHHSSLISKSAIRSRQCKFGNEHEEDSPNEFKVSQIIQNKENAIIAPIHERIAIVKKEEKSKEQSSENVLPNHQIDDDELWSFSFMEKIDDNILAF